MISTASHFQRSTAAVFTFLCSRSNLPPIGAANQKLIGQQLCNDRELFYTIHKYANNNHYNYDQGTNHLGTLQITGVPTISQEAQIMGVPDHRDHLDTNLTYCGGHFLWWTLNLHVVFLYYQAMLSNVVRLTNIYSVTECELNLNDPAVYHT